MKLIFPLVVAAGSLTLVSSFASAAAEPGSQVDELLAVDAAFSAYSVEHGMRAAFTAFAAETAFRFEPGVGVIKGRDAIDAANKNVPKDFKLTWTPISAEVAASGDMGYTFGSYESHRLGADGTDHVGTGHYMTLWRRQADGTWKWVFDTGVADPKPKERASAADGPG